MRRKVLITLIAFSIILFGIILLQILSAFSSFTLGLKEEQYKVLISDAILVLAIVLVLAPIFQVSEGIKKLQQVSKKVKDIKHVSNSKRRLTEAGAYVLIRGNRCYRCGHEWISMNINAASGICPVCKSPYWDRPRRKRKT